MLYKLLWTITDGHHDSSVLNYVCSQVTCGYTMLTLAALAAIPGLEVMVIDGKAQLLEVPEISISKFSNRVLREKEGELIIMYIVTIICGVRGHQLYIVFSA